jgi:hypothetical protein
VGDPGVAGPERQPTIGNDQVESRDHVMRRGGTNPDARGVTATTGTGTSASSDRGAPRCRPRRYELPGAFRLRVVLLALCLLAGGGGGGQLSEWSRLLFALTAAAIPGAVAVQHGRAAVRTLLLGPPGPRRRVVGPPTNPFRARVRS